MTRPKTKPNGINFQKNDQLGGPIMKMMGLLESFENNELTNYLATVNE